jgi:hypothetical protein
MAERRRTQSHRLTRLVSQAGIARIKSPVAPCEQRLALRSDMQADLELPVGRFGWFRTYEFQIEWRGSCALPDRLVRRTGRPRWHVLLCAPPQPSRRTRARVRAKSRNTPRHRTDPVGTSCPPLGFCPQGAAIRTRQDRPSNPGLRCPVFPSWHLRAFAQSVGTHGVRPLTNPRAALQAACVLLGNGGKGARSDLGESEHVAAATRSKTWVFAF